MLKSNRKLKYQLLLIFFSALLSSIVIAGTPLWTFRPLTPTTMSVPITGTAIVQYWVTNQSNRTHQLVMQPILGMTQVTTGLDVCGNIFTLMAKHSCILSLQVNGALLTSPISDGPIVCKYGTTNECYRPREANILHITRS